MKASTFKGAILEYLIRNLLKNCGFTNVKADNLYTYENHGLFYVNGKGAAHDADVIMNPPIQMPFTYPTQLIFECKAYGKSVSLTIVRNALGLRNDINEFEIVTKKSIQKRQNNRRATYAIETRTRFVYQVGVASINDFSKPAVEFAANNKIPLVSLQWFLGPNTIANLNGITQPLIDSFHQPAIDNTYKFFKDREGNLYSNEYLLANNFLNSDNIIGDIVTFSNGTINLVYVGLLETGDMIFLFPTSHGNDNILNRFNAYGTLKAELHWYRDRPNVWRLTVFNSNEPDFRSQFEFFLPNKIFNHWKQFSLDKTIALTIKETFFSRIFVFNKGNNPAMPFSLININLEWLRDIRDRQVSE